MTAPSGDPNLRLGRNPSEVQGARLTPSAGQRPCRVRSDALRPTRLAARGAALVLAALLGVPQPAAAQRSRCGFGAALEALRDAGETLAAAAAAPASLADGRERASLAAGRLRRGEEGLAGCGCRRAAAEAAEAATLAEQALSEASVRDLAATLGHARFRLSLVRERLGREGCA
jgi:hypothetical protein